MSEILDIAGPEPSGELRVLAPPMRIGFEEVGEALVCTVTVAEATAAASVSVSAGVSRDDLAAACLSQCIVQLKTAVRGLQAELAGLNRAAEERRRMALEASSGLLLPRGGRSGLILPVGMGN